MELLYKTIYLSLIYLVAIESIPNMVDKYSSSCNYTFTPYLDNCDECSVTYYSQSAISQSYALAVAYSWPAQVLIFQNFKGIYNINGTNYTLSSIFKCGGTLVNRYTIITAAACIFTKFTYQSYGSRGEPSAGVYILDVYWNGNPFYQTQSSMFTVYLGAYNVYYLSISPTIAMSVNKVIIHPNYDSSNNSNDIALLILSNATILNNYVQPACMVNPKISDRLINDNSTAIQIGWGTSTPGILVNQQINIYNFQLCSNISTVLYKNPNNQICADTFQGDNGGGLYVFDTNTKKYFVAGITSHTSKYSYKYSLYTRISYFYDWIIQNLEIDQNTTATTSTTTTYNSSTSPLVTKTTNKTSTTVTTTTKETLITLKTSSISLNDSIINNSKVKSFKTILTLSSLTLSLYLNNYLSAT